MRIVSRAEWGAAPARSSTPLQADRVSMLVLHHTTGTYAGPQTVRNIQAFHQGPTRGWADVGYNFLVAPDGTIFEGRGWGLVGAHARDRNSVSVGVAFIGDGRREVPVEAQRSIVWLAEEADRRFGRLRRVGHRDVGSTICPGDALHSWWMSGAFLPAAAPTTDESAPEPARASEPPARVVTPEPAQVPPAATTARPGPTVGPRAGGTALPPLPKGLRWGSGGLPRIPWLRG